MKNITNWQTTIPAVAGIIATLLGISGIIDMETVPQLDELIAGMGFTILSIVGLFSRA